MKNLLKFAPVALITSILLSGCVSGGYDLSTPEGRALYERDLAISERMLQESSQGLQYQTQRLQGLAGQMPVPAVDPIGQSNSTSTFYCRDLTGVIITCKQIR